MQSTISKALLRSSALVPLAMAMATVPAFAQDSTETESAAQGSGSDIIVTARKRAEDILDVPVSITALSNDQLVERGIVDFASLNSFAPGFRYENQGSSVATRGFNTFVMRGIYPGSDSPDRQAVSIFIDGVPVGGAGSIPGLADVNQVEIVRGPQSAYFGRSTFAGAVNFVTAAPATEFRAKAQASAGTYDTYNLRGSIEGPLIPEVLSARVTGYYSHEGAQYLNFGHAGDLNRRTTRAYTGSLLLTPADGLRLRGFYAHWEDKDGAPAQAYLNSREYNCNAGAAPTTTFNYICGGISSLPVSAITQNIDVPASVIPSLQNRNTVLGADFIDDFGLRRVAHFGSASAEYEITSNLSLNGYYSWGRTRWAHIVDTYAIYPATAGYTTSITPYDIKNQSTEARLSYDDGRLRALAGFSYFQQRTLTGSSTNRNGAFTTATLPNLSSTDTYGFFGSLSYDITEALSASVEGRYQIDQIGSRVNTVGGVNVEGESKAFTPRVILQYKFNPNFNIYASWSRGTRPAQFNSNVFSLPAAAQAQLQAQAKIDLVVPEEKLWMGELGLKADLLDGRLQVKTAGYYGEWTDKQIQVALIYSNPLPVQAQVVLPQGSVELWGLEFEMNARLTENLTFDGNFAWSETNIRRTSCTDCRTITGNVTPVGTRIARYPVITANAGLAYERELSSEYKGYARLDYIYTGKQYATEANVAWTAPANVFNLKFGVRSAAYTFELWGTNILNDDTPLNIGRRADTFNNSNILILTPARKRTLGARVSVSY